MSLLTALSIAVETFDRFNVWVLARSTRVESKSNLAINIFKTG